MEIDTREATPTDVEALLDLDEIAHTEPCRSELIRNAVAASGCLVTEQDRRVVGYGVLEYSFFGQGFVPVLYVAAPWRRRGAGTALLRALANRCTTPKLFTSTNASNLPVADGGSVDGSRRSPFRASA